MYIFASQTLRSIVCKQFYALNKAFSFVQELCSEKNTLFLSKKKVMIYLEFRKFEN